MKGKTNPNTNTVRVLIIDDDFFVRDALEMFVRSCGGLCTGSPSAEEALVSMEARPYDIVVCDYRLPGLDGLSFFRRIRTLAPKPMKILISAYGNSRLIKEAEGIGVDGFFQKPFSDGQIEIVLNRMIQSINGGTTPAPRAFQGGRK